jgi:hypothetical protein
MRQVVPPRTVAFNVAAAYGQIGHLMELADEERAAGRSADKKIAEIDRLIGLICDTFLPRPKRQEGAPMSLPMRRAGRASANPCQMETRNRSRPALPSGAQGVEPMSVVCQPMPGRLATYKVVVGEGITLGFLRLDVSAQKWIARLPGASDGSTEATIRRFSEKDRAVAWLQERERVPEATKRRRRAA